MTHDAREPATLAEALDLPAEPGLYESRYEVGSEPVSRPRSSSSRRAARLPEEKLAPYLAEARAGASDAVIARATGATEAQVGRWRRNNNVTRPRGRPNVVARTTSLAVEVLGHPFDPVVAEVAGSRVGGRFEPPEYVLRDGLDYDLFVQLVEVLIISGFAEEEIARGLGVRPKDVVIARLLAGSSA